MSESKKLTPLTVAGPITQSTCCCRQETRVGINGPDGHEVAQVLGEDEAAGTPTAEAVAFAEFIVLSANAHEELLAYVKEEHRSEYEGAAGECLNGPECSTCALIAKAEGKR